jgi:DNA-binding transcriptional ArsR family regulator
MPILQGEGESSPSIAVTPSAPTELMFLLHNLSASHELSGSYAGQEQNRLRLGPELASFWGDGHGQSLTELVVLAHRSGTLRDSDLAGFFERIEAAATDPAGIPSLLSETQAERQLVAERLQRLQKDAKLRRGYIALLHSVWEPFEADWNSVGRAAVTAEAVEWERSLNGGTPYRRVVELPRIWPARPQFDEMADAAARAGNLVLTPSWHGGMHFVELDGVVYLGRGMRYHETSYRKVAAEVSTNIKALADPTRLAILLWLARRPASVTEVARHFELAQPTISAHVQVLREAGLLDEKPNGRSAMLSASEDGLRRLFSTAEESLVRLFRD